MFSQESSKSGAPSGTHSVRHIDHLTYVADRDAERPFIDRWSKLGFTEHVRIHTERHRAVHIALVSGTSEEYPWATMTGLSVSEDPESAINEFVRRYGAGVQHVAYNIDPHFDMEQVFVNMKAAGWKFMTPVLTYQDDRGARLRQFFTAPSIPYGPFVEFVQRLSGPEGKAFDGFDRNNIEGLYDHYVEFSRMLDRRK